MREEQFDVLLICYDYSDEAGEEICNAFKKSNSQGTHHRAQEISSRPGLRRRPRRRLHPRRPSRVDPRRHRTLGIALIPLTPALPRASINWDEIGVLRPRAESGSKHGAFRNSE